MSKLRELGLSLNEFRAIAFAQTLAPSYVHKPRSRVTLPLKHSAQKGFKNQQTSEASYRNELRASSKIRKSIPQSTVGNAGLRKWQLDRLIEKYQVQGIIFAGKLIIGTFGEGRQAFFNQKLKVVAPTMLSSDRLIQLIEAHGIDKQATKKSLTQAAKRIGVSIFKKEVL